MNYNNNYNYNNNKRVLCENAYDCDRAFVRVRTRVWVVFVQSRARMNKTIYIEKLLFLYAYEICLLIIIIH